VGVRLTWLWHLLVEGFLACPDHLRVQLPAQPSAVVLARLEAAADERWSCVPKKAHKPWLWSAMDAKRHQIMAFHVGDRSRARGQELWANIPTLSCAQATGHTDQ
jgi:hypothetical protein